MKKNSTTNEVRVIAGILAIVGAMSSFAPKVSAQSPWRFAHSDVSNSGFIVLDTPPAVSPMLVRPLGTVAPGVNPVIGPSGNLYIGNAGGEMLAFTASGAPLWSRTISSQHGGFLGSPVVGADGSVYAISTRRHEELNEKPHDSFLHKFTSGGGWVYSQLLPKTDLYPFLDGGATNAALNIWEWNGTEVIMVPVKYLGLGREEIQLLAFSATTGAVIAKKQVSVKVYEISGGADLPSFLSLCLALNPLSVINQQCQILAAINGDLLGFPSPPSEIPLLGAGFPLAGVAMLPDSPGSPPQVVMTDREHNKVIFAFSPVTGFTERLRVTSGRMFTTPPIVRPNGSITVGTADGYLATTTANQPESYTPINRFLPDEVAGSPMTAVPTLHKNGSLVVVGRDGYAVKFGGGLGWQKSLDGASIASAATSCTHVYISTTNAFYTFNADTMQQVAKIPWVGGGLSTPVIGPYGNVYAIANNYLFVFPAPVYTSINGCRFINAN